MFKAVVKQIRYCCRLWLKNCCKSRDFFYLLQQNLYILYILRARRPRVPTPARPTTTVITLTGDIMLAVIKNLFLVQMTGDMMVVAYCLERAHVGLSGLCHYWCGWARWHKTCIHLSGSSGIYSHNGFKWGQLAQFTLILLTAVFLFMIMVMYMCFKQFLFQVEQWFRGGHYYNVFGGFNNNMHQMYMSLCGGTCPHNDPILRCLIESIWVQTSTDQIKI